MQPIAEASGVELQATFEPEHLRVLADPERLQQIVWNLLSNAIKFSVKGGVVRLTAGSRGGNFRLTVEDHGAGISPEFLPRVFDRFSQGDASITRRHAGLGIGLAIVKQLVEMQQGTITAASKGAGHGATFTLELPLTDEVGATRRSGIRSAIAYSIWPARWCYSSKTMTMRASSPAAYCVRSARA